MRLATDLYLSRATLPAFAIQGYGWGAFAALVPQLKSGIGAPDGTFGMVLLFAAAGAMSAMLLAPRIDRRLDRWSQPIAGLFMISSFVAVALAAGPLAFAAAMFCVGIGAGLLDVVMNARVSEIESRSGRPLMSLNHAGFSLAYAVSAVCTGLAREAGAAPVQIFAVLVAVTVVVGLVIRLPSADAAEGTGGRSGGRLGPLVVLAGAITLIAFVAENATEGWSALHIERTLGGSAVEGGLGPAMLGLTMALGRFLGHVLSVRGREAMLIGAAALGSALGAGLAAVAPAPAVAYLGFAVLGLGVSVIAPLAIGLAGALAEPARRTETVSRVVMIGFVGFFIGPPLMGLISEAAGLRASFAAIALGLLAVPLLLGALRRSAMP
ncbi:MAG: MFS transporter [Paracoccaceae bacterium]